MNRFQFLLVKLAEEANEVGQMSLKTAQFGKDEIMPTQPLTNAERTHLELDDLMAIVEMLNEEYQFGYQQNEENKVVKKNKVNKFYNYSVSLGLIT